MNWDKVTMFNAKTGQQGIRWASSEREGVHCEFSMHDETIQALLPANYWLPVLSATVNNAKIDRIDGRLVALFGLGKPSDPMGNLVLVRLATRPGHNISRLNDCILHILAMLQKFGIKPDKRMEDTIRGN